MYSSSSGLPLGCDRGGGIGGASTSGIGGVGVRGWPSATSVSSSGKRIQKEMQDLNADPLADCSAGPKGDNLYNWVSTIIGPHGSPYEGGIFFLDIGFPVDYPFKPPTGMVLSGYVRKLLRVMSSGGKHKLLVDGNWQLVFVNQCCKLQLPLVSNSTKSCFRLLVKPNPPIQVTFKTRICHCNVDSDGKLSIDILKDGWSPALTISKVLVAIKSIIANPDPYNPSNLNIAELYLNDRVKHDEIAAEWTMRFAR